MPERIQKTKQSTKTEESVDSMPSTEKKDMSAIDDLLDEIDEVLEENAEEFVKSYIQKGGQ